ncbi:uncharacterized protein SAPINGB_P002105 [Magnusiomyces paraingens]|uniref:Rab-GAP TBC domain-containing protein n=1 Tax=Magnusiomyces paraingens TaxID=2606893 RepID=A0A5E8BK77_9ASCO|nr:uncharacterized protein SAPINGB_P002105 [Saprochaete ingens]VVT49103.1 unnamed protein product [Saprochaete ingens]
MSVQPELAAINWNNLFAIEQTLLVQQSTDCSLFSDIFSHNAADADHDNVPPSTQSYSPAQLKHIIDSSGNLPFNDIPDLPKSSLDPPQLNLWAALLSNYRNAAQRIPHYAVSAIHSGIPPALRGAAWQVMAESSSNAALDSLYDSLAEEWTPFVKIIGRDLNRTFPEIKMFQERGGPGQVKLGRVLRAYAAYDIQVGYCQGLTFLTGPLLLHMDDRAAFCTLIQLMEDYNLRSMFTADMAGLQLRLYQFERLFESELPELHAHFLALGVSNIYASQWFLSFFAVTCPLAMLVRLFDLVFAEGAIPTLMRTALALLSRNSPILMAFDADEQILQHVLGRSVWDVFQNNPDTLIADVVTFPTCSMNHLKTLETEFNSNGKPRMTNGEKPSKQTSSSTTNHNVPLNKFSMFFTQQVPMAFKWTTPDSASPTNVEDPQATSSTTTTPSTSTTSLPSTNTATTTTTSSIATHSNATPTSSRVPSSSLTPFYQANRLSVASLDSTDSSSSTSSSSRIYSGSNTASSVSSFTIYDGPPSRPSLIGPSKSDETLVLREKVAALSAEVEKLRFELTQRERISQPLEEKSQEVNNDDDDNDDEKHPCETCEKLRMELALAKTNEALANAEIEELRHALLARKRSGAHAPSASVSVCSSSINNPNAATNIKDPSEKPLGPATRGWTIW